MGKASGVVVSGGDVISASHAIVSNVPVWALPKMLPESFTTKFLEFDIVEHTSGLKKELDDTPKTDSFMHLHLGIDGRSTTRLRYSTTRPRYSTTRLRYS